MGETSRSCTPMLGRFRGDCAPPSTPYTSPKSRIDRNGFGEAMDGRAQSPAGVSQPASHWQSHRNTANARRRLRLFVYWVQTH